MPRCWDAAGNWRAPQVLGPLDCEGQLELWGMESLLPLVFNSIDPLVSYSHRKSSFLKLKSGISFRIPCSWDPRSYQEFPNHMNPHDRGFCSSFSFLFIIAFHSSTSTVPGAGPGALNPCQLSTAQSPSLRIGKICCAQSTAGAMGTWELWVKVGRGIGVALGQQNWSFWSSTIHFVWGMIVTTKKVTASGDKNRAAVFPFQTWIHKQFFCPACIGECEPNKVS